MRPSSIAAESARTATMPAADSPGLTMTLALSADGAASMTSDYQNGQPPIVETGGWQQNDDGTVTTTFTMVDGRTLATPDVLTFALEDGGLVAVDYDEVIYGSQGLTMLPPGKSTAPSLQATPLPPAPEPTALPAPALTPVASNQIQGATWQLQEIRAGGGRVIQVADPAKYTLTLNADGTANMVADCNSGKGTYTLTGDKLNLKLGFTRKLCPQPSLFNQVNKYLQFADTAALQNASLVVGYGNGGGALIFKAAQ